jgi:linoleoyl-CoA desaturase
MIRGRAGVRHGPSPMSEARTKRAVHFTPSSAFHAALKRRAASALLERGLPAHGGSRILLKAALILALLVGSYLALLFWAEAWWEVALSAFLLSQAIVLVGFNVMHDAGHASFSNRQWVNRLMSRSLDLVGGSSVLWRVKHGILHHSYTNLDELDDDIDTNGLLRLHPSQPHRPYHRYQTLYALPLYSLLALHWMISDFSEFFGGRVGRHTIGRPSLRETLIFLAFKLNFFLLAIVLPLALRPWQGVLAVGLSIQLVVGFTLALVFQLAHAVDVVDRPVPTTDTQRLADEWSVHQLRTTADFSADNAWVSWYCGGLNRQVEHHLFSRISHVRYRHLLPVVEKTCREFGVRYRSYPTLLAAIRGHLRLLSALGRGEPLAA